MWLPTFIGHNSRLKREIEERLGPEFKGRELTEETLDEMHTRVIEFICEKFPLNGLRDYLDSVKFVSP